MQMDTGDACDAGLRECVEVLGRGQEPMYYIVKVWIGDVEEIRRDFCKSMMIWGLKEGVSYQDSNGTVQCCVKVMVVGERERGEIRKVRQGLGWYKYLRSISR